MKGPGGRIRFDLRRVWECPVCHRRDWTSGDIVFRQCTCSAKSEPNRQIWMKLVETELTAPTVQQPLEPPPGPTLGNADPEKATNPQQENA